MKRHFLATAALLLVAACTPPNTYDRAAVLQSNQLNAKDILLDVPVHFATVKRGERCGDMAVFCAYRGTFFPGILMLQKDKVAIFRNLGVPGTKEVELKFEEIEGVATATWGLFQNMHQVQLLTQTKVYAFNTEQPADLQRKLQAAGLKLVEPIGRVVDDATSMRVIGPPS